MHCYQSVTLGHDSGAKAAQPGAKNSAPTWPPQTAQQNWSDRRPQRNFNKGWSGSSPHCSGRVMPKRSVLELSLISVRRRDPAGIALRSSRPVTAGRLRNGRLCGLDSARTSASEAMPRSTPFEFRVSVETRPALLNRAFTSSPPGSGAECLSPSTGINTRRCTLQNGLPARESRAAHGVHG